MAMEKNKFEIYKQLNAKLEMLKYETSEIEALIEELYDNEMDNNDYGKPGIR